MARKHSALATETRKYFTVVVHRTITREMCVGILADTEKEATEQVLAMRKINSDAGWTELPEGSPPKVAGVLHVPGVFDPATGRWIEAR